MMGKSSREFWEQGLGEWSAALSGFMEFNGTASNQPFTRADLEDLMEKYPD